MAEDEVVVKPSLQSLQEEIEAAERELGFERLNPPPRWRHKANGHEYGILCVALEEATLTPLVVYRPLNVIFDRCYFTRPLQQFLQRFERLE